MQLFQHLQALVNAVLDELIRNALEALHHHRDGWAHAIEKSRQDPPEEGDKLSFLQFLVITKGEDVTTRPDSRTGSGSRRS